MKYVFQKKSLVLSVILFIFSCFVFMFLYKNINSNQEMLKISQEKLQIETAYRDNARLLTNSIRAIESERILLDQHFIKSSDVVPFLDMIEKLSKDAGSEAEISSVDILKDTSSLVVDTKVLGSFEEIYKFITLIENSPYNLEFIKVDIKNLNPQDIVTNKNNNNQKWMATLKIKLLGFIN